MSIKWANNTDYKLLDKFIGETGEPTNNLFLSFSDISGQNQHSELCPDRHRATGAKWTQKKK